MANKQRDPERERFWRRALAWQGRSGLSIRAFCRREKVSEPSFYAWRREIARRDDEMRRRNGRATSAGKRRRRAAQAKRPRHAAPPAFLPVILNGDPPPLESTGIVIELRGGRKLRLSESTPAARLAELVCAIEVASDNGDASGTDNVEAGS